MALGSGTAWEPSAVRLGGKHTIDLAGARNYERHGEVVVSRRVVQRKWCTFVGLESGQQNTSALLCSEVTNRGKPLKFLYIGKLR